MQKTAVSSPSVTPAAPSVQQNAQTKGAAPLREMVIPACPELLVALRKEMNKEDPDPGVVASIASRDVAMSGALLRTANSPYYARSRAAASVSDALGMLGVRMAEKLLTAILMRQAIGTNSTVLAHFWDTSTRRAMVMTHIARQLFCVDAELAYTCGLFCHVGIPILMQGVPGYAATLAQALEHDDRSFTATENAAHKTDHAVVGSLVARTWNLPASIVQAVRLHHDFTILQDQSVETEVRALVAMALVAEHLVAMHESAPEQPEWKQHGQVCLSYLNVSGVELETWLDALHAQLDSVSIG